MLYGCHVEILLAIFLPYPQFSGQYSLFLHSSVTKGTNSEQRPLSRYKQSQLQRKVRGRYDGNEREWSWQDERDSKGLQELSQYAEELM